MVLSTYLLVIGSLAFYNALQCFVPSMRLTPKIYAKQPQQVTPLMSRMMGTWTLTSGFIRIYAAYHLSNPVAYQLCMWTFVIALGSFLSEVFIFKTAPITSPGVFPALLVSSGSLAWMISSYSSIVVPMQGM